VKISTEKLEGRALALERQARLAWAAGLDDCGAAAEAKRLRGRLARLARRG